MDRAILEAELPESATAIIRPFLHDVATFLINRGSTPNLVS